jgi:uncharacterized membrane protein
MAGNEDPPPSSEDAWRAAHPYRLAGEDFGRILALSDGVFAFAMTLLVISLIVPGASGSNVTTPGNSAALGHDLLNDWQAIFGFVFGFVMIGVWWVTHNRTFQYIARYDSALVWINIMILIQVSLMPFVVGVYNTFTSGPRDYQSAVILFAGIQVTLGLTNLLLYEYAHYAGLLKKGVPESVSDYYTKRGLFTSAVFAISIGVSFYRVDLAQLCWIGIVLAQRFSLRIQTQKLPGG